MPVPSPSQARPKPIPSPSHARPKPDPSLSQARPKRVPSLWSNGCFGVYCRGVYWLSGTPASWFMATASRFIAQNMKKRTSKAVFSSIFPKTQQNRSSKSWFEHWSARKFLGKSDICKCIVLECTRKLGWQFTARLPIGSFVEGKHLHGCCSYRSSEIVCCPSCLYVIPSAQCIQIDEWRFLRVWFSVK